MLVKKTAILAHLSRIFLEKEIREVVLESNFQCRAATEDRTLLVTTAGLEDADPLDEPVGVMDLELFIKTLKLYGEDGNEDLALTIEDSRIVLKEKGRGMESRIVTADNETISTSISEKAASNVLDMLDFKKAPVLPQSTVESILKAQGLLKAEDITIQRRKDGITFVVGPEEGSHTLVTLPSSKAKKGDDIFEMRVSAKQFCAILGVINDFVDSTIYITENLLGVQAHGFTFCLSALATD